MGPLPLTLLAAFLAGCFTPAATQAFNKMTDKRALGGTNKPLLTELTRCNTACADDAACVGLDWNKATTVAAERCWLHTEESGGCNTLRTSTCCDHYQKTSYMCKVIAGYTLLRSVALETAGVLQTATTLEGCRSLCNSDNKCEGFDFNPFNQCQLYTSGNVCGALKKCTGCNSYRKVRFQCTFRFSKGHKRGGVAVAAGAGKTMQECEKECRTSATCQGFDFNSDSTVLQPCWLHAASACSSPLSVSATINHYRMRSVVCPGEPGTPDWANVEQNMHTVGNQLLLGGTAVSAVDCIKMCAAAPATLGCMGVDYDKATEKCYLVTRRKACESGIPNNCCDRIVLPTACSPATVPDYTASSMRHRLYGVRIPMVGLGTPSKCGDLCRKDPLCGGFDFDLDGECWTHSKTQECTNLTTIFENKCCDHYVKTTTCTSYKIPEFIGYSRIVKMSARGGRAVLNKQTEGLCVSECSKTTSCQSVDFNIKDSTCFLHTKTSGCARLLPNQQVYHYSKDAVAC